MEQNGYDGPFLAYAKAFTVAKFTNHPFSLLDTKADKFYTKCCKDMVVNA